jgi:hypothetical protein
MERPTDTMLQFIPEGAAELPTNNDQQTQQLLQHINNLVQTFLRETVGMQLGNGTKNMLTDTIYATAYYVASAMMQGWRTSEGVVENINLQALLAAAKQSGIVKALEELTPQQLEMLQVTLEESDPVIADEDAVDTIDLPPLHKFH